MWNAHLTNSALRCGNQSARAPPVMRAAEARVTLGVTAARRGDLVRTVTASAPDAPVVQDFTDRVRALRTS